MAELDTTLRNTLERLVVDARDVSETAAEATLKALGVHQKDAPAHLTEDHRALRRTLRAKARQLGDALDRNPNDPIPGLTQELAYERWHQMLFATFLAHNDLLMHPTEKVSVSLQECDELAQVEGDANGWQTAARYASHMLPSIFRPHDPLLRVRFAPEHQQALERILDDIPEPTYASDDGLGWVYQFWQTKQKKAVNDSGRKIGGADIAPVTQLFTEHYMVQFLLHNTLGAWWTARHPDIPLPTSKSYLRTLEDGTPAAGTFDGWPDAAKDITVMDPCCGSGHFLVAAFTLLQRFRMIEEGLSEAEAGDAVLRDNIHGLEIDPRCTQLAAFNLALHTWKNGGYRLLPQIAIACSGVAASESEQAWSDLSNDPKSRATLKELHRLFEKAPDLGSLIDPRSLQDTAPLFLARFSQIQHLLDQVPSRGSTNIETGIESMIEVIRGVSHAAALLSRVYTLTITNVPYLGRNKQGDLLKEFLENNYPSGKGDLAAAFVLRSQRFCASGGSCALVLPQALLTQKAYAILRARLMTESRLTLLAKIGKKAFRAIGGEVVNVAILVSENSLPSSEAALAGLDVSGSKYHLKAVQLLNAAVRKIPLADIASSSSHRISFASSGRSRKLRDYVSVAQGIKTGDDPRFRRLFWEVAVPDGHWKYVESAGARGSFGIHGGCMYVLDWSERGRNLARLQGLSLVGHRGVTVSTVGALQVKAYLGHPFTSDIAAIVPLSPDDYKAVYAYCTSIDFVEAVRELDSGLAISTATFGEVPVDLNDWREEATLGTEPPYSDDPTQWLFHGHPIRASEVLHVSVARVLGYQWPAEEDSTIELSDEGHSWLERSKQLRHHAASDGIVCLPAIAGEKPASERLRELLMAAKGDGWSPSTEASLLATVGYDGKTLQDWLWGDFFKQHCKLFHNRPFIWHITDGLKDGFSALVNYHKLDRALLERLIYTYLGSWIRQQEEAAAGNVRGADRRLEAAQGLKTKLELILEGEPPYDIFVRWKALHEQPIGWDPDLNDGVRINIRPFVTAGVLRSKFTINWNKDRGNDPEPNVTGTTERYNDRHFTNQEKRAAREANPR